jgi:hypothetical protein
MSDHDRQIESRKASVRARVEHLQMLFASANWLMRARAVALTGAAA